MIKQDVLILTGKEDHMIPLKMHNMQVKALTNAKSITDIIFTKSKYAILIWGKRLNRNHIIRNLIMANNSAAVETFNLTKNFGSLTAVNNLDLTANKGEIFGFLGPNGAGKTTTIKLLTGLLKPTSGTAKIMGADIQQTRRASAQQA